MFDLFRRRDRAVRYLLTALLAMTAVSMVTYLIPGSGGSGSRSDDTVVAQIGGDVITTRDVQTQVRESMRRRNVPSTMLQFYVPQIIDQMVSDRAMAYEAERLGFEVSDADLARTLRSLLQPLMNNGEIDRTAYRQYLSQQGMTEAQYEHNVRQQMLLLRLQNLSLEGIVVAPKEVEAAYKSQNEQIKVEYLAISQEKLRPQAQLSQPELQAYFSRNRNMFETPQKRGFDLLLVEETKISESMNLPEEQVRQAYEAKKDTYRTPERVKVRHILVMTQGKPADETPKLKAKAEDLLKKIKGGADFAELAKKNSDDPSSAKNGGSMDWIVRGQMVKNFEDTSFSLKKNEISGVITTEYGFHIVQLLDRQDARLKPFDEVKDELAKEIKKSAVFDRIQTLADQAHAALLKAPKEAAKIAQQLNIRYVRVDKISGGETVPGVGPGSEINAAISPLKIGEVTQVTQLPNDRLAVAVVTDIFKAHPAEFAEVESQVRQSATMQRLAKLVESTGKEAREKLNQFGGDMAKVAKAMNLELKTTPPFKRNTNAEGIGNAAYLADLFSQPVGSIVGPFSPSTPDVYIVKSTGKLPADMSQLAAAREGIVTDLKKKKSNEADTLFKDSILSRLEKDGKVKLHNDVIKRLIASNRG